MAEQKSRSAWHLVPKAQQSAFAKLSFWGKLGYLWHYYWLYLLIIVALAGAVIGFAASALNAPDDVRLYVMVESPAEGEEEALVLSLEKLLGCDGKKSVVQTEAVMFSSGSPQHVYEQMNVSVKAAANCVDVVICNKELYDYLLSVCGIIRLSQAPDLQADSGEYELVFSRAGNDDPMSDFSLEADAHPYAVKLADGRYLCVAASSLHQRDALTALAFIAKGAIR